jgi:DNA-binding transcriptional MerR regulator
MKGQGGVEKAPEAFRTISEVADDLDVPQHVLRFWESRFSQIKPMKRGGGRRYYRPDDVALLRGIRHLLYGQGYTIRGAQRILREQGVRFVQTVWEEGAAQPVPSADDIAAAPDEAEQDIGAEHRPSGQPYSFDADDEPPVPRSERQEPRLVSPHHGPNAPNAHRALSPADRETLQAALAELAECRRLLTTAVEDAT